MIQNFKQYGLEHIVSILIPCILGLAYIFWGLKSKSESSSRLVRILLAITIVAIRSARYIMDIYYNRFDWFDLFSLHICHIDLILLVICLIKPSEILFNFVFLIGIPMGFAVALFPGSVHAEPGKLRAMFFIMSHMMLVTGAIYLTVVEQMKATVKYFLGFGGAGGVSLAVIYLVNLRLKTNFLYIVEAPAGTVIEKLEGLFGWPGYVLVMYVSALFLMLTMLTISKAVDRYRYCQEKLTM
ncbi:MAG: hypothetical protein ACOZCL_11995 [Bacillota bacterium]